MRCTEFSVLFSINCRLVFPEILQDRTLSLYATRCNRYERALLFASSHVGSRDLAIPFHNLIGPCSKSSWPTPQIRACENSLIRKITNPSSLRCASIIGRKHSCFTTSQFTMCRTQVQPFCLPREFCALHSGLLYNWVTFPPSPPHGNKHAPYRSS